MIKPRAGATVLLAAAIAAVAVAGSSQQVHQLPSKDRAYLDKILGKGVVGEALPAKQIADIKTIHERWIGRKVIRRVVHGDNKGDEYVAMLERLDRPDAAQGYRLETGGKTVLYGEFTPDGGMNQTAADDRKEGVITQYDPPVPVFRANQQVGQVITVDTNVKVFDLTNPGKQKHSGKMRVTMEYLGAFRVTVPAGTFDTVCMKWTYDGKVGPAAVEDVSYWFFDEQFGPVAWVNKTDVSAVLIYQSHEKRASVLVRVVEE